MSCGRVCSRKSFSGSKARPASSISTSMPASASTFAAQPPVAPEPTTTASQVFVSEVCFTRMVLGGI